MVQGVDGGDELRRGRGHLRVTDVERASAPRRTRLRPGVDHERHWAVLDRQVTQGALHHPRHQVVAVFEGAAGAGDTTEVRPDLNGEVDRGDDVLAGPETNGGGGCRVIKHQRRARQNVDHLRVHLAEGELQVYPLQDRVRPVVQADVAVGVLN